MRRFLVIVVGLAMAAGVGVVIYRKVEAKRAAAGAAGGNRGRAPVAVEVATVRQAPIRDVRLLSGTLRANTQFSVASKVAGRLEALAVHVGDSIRRGQEIGHLESEEYVQRVEQARAELQVAQASVEQYRRALEQARREFDRAKALREKKIASQAELDAAESNLQITEANEKVALAQVAQRQAALRAAEVQLSYTRVVAFWEDTSAEAVRVVGERFVDEGAMLKANDPIVSVVQLDPIVSVVQVTEREYPMVRVGQTTELTCDAFPGRVFTGNILRVAPLLRETSREAQVEIEVANGDHALKPGMFVRVTLELARRDNATLVPVSAIVRRGEDQGVFLVDSAAKTVRFVPVQPGIQAGDQAEIVSPELSGLVVTMGQHLLDDGRAVLLPAATPGDAAGSAVQSTPPAAAIQKAGGA